MHQTIDFPNLGIHLENVGDHISIFGFDIAFYGILIGIGILSGVLIASHIAKKTGQDPDLYFDLAMYAVVLSIIGARVYYVVFSWDMYKNDWKSIFNIRQGGLAIYGGIITAIITVFVYGRIKNISAPILFDTVGPGLAIGQAIGRWGNFFNREAFGEYTNGLLAMKLPVDAVRTSDITELMQKHLEEIDGVSYIQVHPTYLYESLWCLCLLIFLLNYRKHKKFDGEVFLLYLLGYALGRVWIEGLRTDQLKLPGVGFPVSQLLAGIMIVGSIILIVWGRQKKKIDQSKNE